MELEYWLRLGNARNLSPFVYTRLLQHFHSPRGICEAGAAALAAWGVKPEAVAELVAPNRASLAGQFSWAQQPKQTILTLADSRYPALLKTIVDPPPVLFVRGDPAVLSAPQLAMVGSRRPSPGGIKAAAELAESLATAGLTITSGLAVGIDAACHRGALKAGGVTIAVLGSGLSRIYPAHHQKLAVEIAEKGAVISEFSPHVSPLPAHFPRRNRIISGLSRGVCIVEATERSGSLITAKLAAEQGREVFAVPGSIYNPLAQGCHRLIQEGAKLTAEAADILAELGLKKVDQGKISTNIPAEALELDYDCRQLLQCVGFEATTVDQIVQRSGRCAAQVTELLLVLELKGYVHPAGGGYFCR
jgi:DNA processing protein